MILLNALPGTVARVAGDPSQVRGWVVGGGGGQAGNRAAGSAAGGR